jgi:hypothetical protein
LIDVSRLDEDILQTDDNKVAALKKAFVIYTKGDQVRLFSCF